MGIEQSAYKGHKSNYGLYIDGNSINAYKTPKYAKKAKNELYELFLQDKLVHISAVQEELNKIAQLQADNEVLQRDVELFKKKLLELTKPVEAQYSNDEYS